VLITPTGQQPRAEALSRYLVDAVTVECAGMDLRGTQLVPTDEFFIPAGLRRMLNWFV
jgi:hypothetical protein